MKRGGNQNEMMRRGRGRLEGNEGRGKRRSRPKIRRNRERREMMERRGGRQKFEKRRGEADLVGKIRRKMGRREKKGEEKERKAVKDLR
jgi:hypothetical protein